MENHLIKMEHHLIKMEKIAAEITFVKIALGSFVGNPDENQRQELLISELESISDENLKKQLKGYIISSVSELKRARDQLQEEELLLQQKELRLMTPVAGSRSFDFSLILTFFVSFS